jgi:hypothetical protein
MDTFIANRRSLDAERIESGFNIHDETKPATESATFHFSPRDRDASFDPPLVVGSDSGLAGQASTASLVRNEIEQNAKEQIESNTAHIASNAIELNATKPIESNTTEQIELNAKEQIETNANE